MAAPRLDPDHGAVLLVDVQEKLLPHMHNHDALVGQAGRLIDGAKVLELPLLVTEQYPKGLGPTVASLSARFPEGQRVHEKLKFSACIDAIRRELADRAARWVLVFGIEAHVCVLQTCLDLLEGGHLAVLVVDAIGSRRAVDQDTAVLRMVQAGVVPTSVESALLEIAHEAAGDRFRALLPIIR